MISSYGEYIAAAYGITFFMLIVALGRSFWQVQKLEKDIERLTLTKNSIKLNTTKAKEEHNKRLAA